MKRDNRNKKEILIRDLDRWFLNQMKEHINCDYILSVYQYVNKGNVSYKLRYSSIRYVEDEICDFTYRSSRHCLCEFCRPDGYYDDYEDIRDFYIRQEREERFKTLFGETNKLKNYFPTSFNPKS